jgi:hypothetical protein
MTGKPGFEASVEMWDTSRQLKQDFVDLWVEGLVLRTHSSALRESERNTTDDDIKKLREEIAVLERLIRDNSLP